MENFGWPMGPAYLLDVIGLDTACHASEVMAAAYPDRMRVEQPSLMNKMLDNKLLGQKNGHGFYAYMKDKKGRIVKTANDSVDPLIGSVVLKHSDISDEEIIDRMMIPMINESIRCLEEKIVATPMEVDLGVIYGLGFPPFS